MTKISTFLSEQLQLNEKVRFTATISKAPLLAYLIGTIFFSIILSQFGFFGYSLIACLILSTLVQYIVYFVHSISAEFLITDQRIMGKTGFISRNTFEIPLEQGEGIMVKQTLLGRMLNYGTIFTSGTGSSAVVMMFVEDPFIVRKKVLEAKTNFEKPLNQKSEAA
ncbi:hypothetical protein A6D98_19470 [Aliivibrio fischeri]|uniref:PH domain-containing protein n=1 Tax=Aliivibrio fischeri TaxID=668 RepID=UPI00080EBBE7|nr:PH domain-containing protein [Aliivibrio fischeri]OCH01443.1 hypothetical protein A6E10_04465 [Aliivibrio fischeri]OCH57485.1 hypothetical protein A6D98_19470 [Aliivibrio fischeri]